MSGLLNYGDYNGNVYKLSQEVKQNRGTTPNSGEIMP